MAKETKEVSEKVETKSKTKKVTLVKEHPLCGNPEGSECELPIEFAEMLIAEKFAK
jgi:hypothetical protein